MRVLFLFLFLTIFTFSIAAQTIPVNQSFELATQLARSEQFEQAIEKYRLSLLQAENEFSNNDILARIHFNIGVCYYQSKNSVKAVAEYNEAIKQSRGTYQKAFYALGMAHSNLENWRKAEAALRKAIELKQNDGEAWFDLAFVFLREENFEQAEKAFQKSIEYKSRGAADAHNNLGVILALRHDFALAENEFQAALDESDGKSIEAKNNLRFCRLYQRQTGGNLLAKLEFSKFQFSNE
jgi:Flp pilus assembly protein TadD